MLRIVFVALAFWLTSMSILAAGETSAAKSAPDTPSSANAIGGSKSARGVANPASGVLDARDPVPNAANSNPGPAAAPSDTPPKRATAEPYEFKGIRLGISVDQFRRTPYPDAADPPIPGAENSKAHVACTGDSKNWPYSIVEVYDHEKAVGIVKCAFFGTSSMLGFKMGGVRGASYNYEFLFASDPNGVMRLFKIVLPTNIAARQDVVSALTSKFGAATKTSTTSVGNALGASFPQHTYTWSNGVSSIFVQGPFSTINKMIVVYTLDKLAAHVNALIEADKPPIKNRM